MTDTRPTPTAPADASVDETATGPSFAELGVPAALTRLLAEDGVSSPFPIQAATLPDSLAGRDVLGRGRTGSGKTLAFALPVLTRLSQSGSTRQPKRPRALILAPTRELALQIETALKPLAEALDLRTMSIFGGVGQNPQVTKLSRGVDIVVACPGRLEDLIAQGHARLDAVEITVLDEADHMADLGFLPGVKRIMDKTPEDGQRMLFSATLDNGIDVLVRRYLTNPVTHSVDSEQSPVGTMDHHVFHVTAADRLPVLVDLTSAPGRTKYRAKTLTKQLISSGVPAVEMHGNLSQNVRVRNLAAFSEGRAVALVATDIAARGIHVDEVTLVIHADPPTEHKAYLHRSGRTARAGNEGTVVTIATEAERREVSQLTRKAGINPTVTVVRAGDRILAELAPGDRTVLSAEEITAALAFPEPSAGGGGGGGGQRRSSSGGAGGGDANRSGRRSGGGGAGRGAGSGGGRSRSGSGARGASAGGQRSASSSGGGQRRSGASRSR